MRQRLATLLAATLLLTSLGFAPPILASESGTAVLDWNKHAVDAIFNMPTAAIPGAGQTPPVGSLNIAMVQIAVFDAINAIEGGYDPYLDGLPSVSPDASQAAAAAVAAHDTLMGARPALPDGIKARLGTLLGASLAGPSSPQKDAGIAIGAAAAAAILANRANDNRFGPFRFTEGTLPGQWRATSGVNDPAAWVKDVRPFTLRHGAQYMAEGAPALASVDYAAQYEEVRLYGSLTGSLRSGDQTATALYFTENPFTLYNRSFRELADGNHEALSAVEAARLLAMANVGGADAAIACWNNKAHSSNWRPITAINDLADDGNAATTPQPGWTSLVAAPPYPDNTSGYNCATGGTMFAARAFFGTDKVSFDLVNAAQVRRSYDRLTDVLHDTIDARVWLGIHFRFADEQGAWVGKKVGQWVGSRFFEPVK
jgi:hypothetical protein